MNRPSPADTKLLICVWHPFTEWRPKPIVADVVRRRWPQMNVVHLPDYDRLPQELPDADILVGASLRQDQFGLAKKLKWIHSTAAGVSQLMYPEIRSSNIIVTNAKGIFSVPMAEHTMGLLIGLARNFPDSVRLQDQKQWGQQILWNKPQRLSELNGKLLLIVGYGSIGQEIARLARAFGMRVWGVTRSGNGDDSLAERILATQQLDDVIAEADYIICAVPETSETQRIIGAGQLAKMKRGARLINVGRGSAIDEAALVSSLKSGTLAGAALDVTETEPLPEESPLWHAPNLFLTPHTSATSDRLWERETDLLVRLLECWFDEKKLFNLVDLQREY